MGKKIIEIVTLFGLIFTFKTPIIGFSSILMLMWLLLLIIPNLKYLKLNINAILNNKKIIILISILFGIILLTFLVTIFHGIYDFSLLPTLINQLFNIGLILLYICIFYRKKNTYYYYLELICICFTIQGGIMLVSLIFPKFKSIIEMTQNPIIVLKSLSQYGGNRNLAFGLTQFYGLNASMGIVFLLNSFLCVEFKKIRYFIFLLFIGIGVFFSGRTSMIGVFLGLLYIIINIKLNIKKDYKLFIGIICFIFLLLLSFNFIKNILPKTIIEWAFEFLINYEEKGELASRSSNTLLNRMHFIPEESIIFFGSGKYTEIDGSYFMRTDAGFMRPLLYYGFLGVLLYLFYYLKILKYIYNYLSVYVSQKRLNIFFILLVLFSIMLNIKGEFIGFLIMSQNIFYLVLLSLMLNKRNIYVK